MVGMITPPPAGGGGGEKVGLLVTAYACDVVFVSSQTMGTRAGCSLATLSFARRTAIRWEPELVGELAGPSNSPVKLATIDIIEMVLATRCNMMGIITPPPGGNGGRGKGRKFDPIGPSQLVLVVTTKGISKPTQSLGAESVNTTSVASRATSPGMGAGARAANCIVLTRPPSHRSRRKRFQKFLQAISKTLTLLPLPATVRTEGRRRSGGAEY